jgi:hypothetical protein
LAERWCASCHLGRAGATSSECRRGVVRRDRAFTAEGLAFFLLDPHPKMPDMHVTRSEAQDLAAYIKSLR